VAPEDGASEDLAPNGNSRRIVDWRMRTILYGCNIGPAPFGGNPTFVDALPRMYAAHRNISHSKPKAAALTVIPVGVLR
jgi:hypothetical protein